MNEIERQSLIFPRVKSRLKELGWSYATFAHRMRVEPQTVYNWNIRGFPANRSIDAANVLGVRLKWLAHGEEPQTGEEEAKSVLETLLDRETSMASQLQKNLQPFEHSIKLARQMQKLAEPFKKSIELTEKLNKLSNPLADFSKTIEKLDKVFPHLQRQIEMAEQAKKDAEIIVSTSMPPPAMTLSNNETSNIPILSASAAMGAGIDANLRHDDVLGSLSIPKEWLRNQLNHFGGAEHLSLITGQGDSMSPTIKHDDLVFVDQSVVEISRDGVYVFSYENELYIKRLQRKPDGSLDMISDNEMYKTVSISKKKRQHLRIIGAIVGVMGCNKI